MLHPHVLVVEDNVRISTALLCILNKSGCEVLLAATVMEAMEHLPWANCVVLDLRLPDGSGKSILERVRQDKLPVHIAIHSSLPPADFLDILELSPDAVFQKPVEPKQLVEWIRQLSLRGEPDSCARLE